MRKKLEYTQERVQELHQDQGAFEESSSLAFVVLTKQVKSLKEAYSQLADSFLEEMERVHSLVRHLAACSVRISLARAASASA